MQFTSRLPFTLLIIAILASGMSLLLTPETSHAHQLSNDDSRPLQVSLLRIVGYAVGTDIQGHFQLNVAGPSNLTHVTIYFNHTLVHNTTQHHFTWPFYTIDYPLGWTTIRVEGRDTSGTHYEWSQLKRFVPPDVNTPYWIAAFLFIIIFTISLIAIKAYQFRHKTTS
jgi:hypothetical protein